MPEQYSFAAAVFIGSAFIMYLLILYGYFASPLSLPCRRLPPSFSDSRLVLVVVEAARPFWAVRAGDPPCPDERRVSEKQIMFPLSRCCACARAHSAHRFVHESGTVRWLPLRCVLVRPTSCGGPGDWATARGGCRMLDILAPPLAEELGSFAPPYLRLALFGGARCVQAFAYTSCLRASELAPAWPGCLCAGFAWLPCSIFRSRLAAFAPAVAPSFHVACRALSSQASGL